MLLFLHLSNALPLCQRTTYTFYQVTISWIYGPWKYRPHQRMTYHFVWSRFHVAQTMHRQRIAVKTFYSIFRYMYSFIGLGWDHLHLSLSSVLDPPRGILLVLITVADFPTTVSRRQEPEKAQPATKNMNERTQYVSPFPMHWRALHRHSPLISVIYFPPIFLSRFFTIDSQATVNNIWQNITINLLNMTR